MSSLCKALFGLLTALALAGCDNRSIEAPKKPAPPPAPKAEPIQVVSPPHSHDMPPPKPPPAKRHS